MLRTASTHDPASRLSVMYVTILLLASLVRRRSDHRLFDRAFAAMHIHHDGRKVPVRRTPE
jgi:hypothetical protein